MLGPPSLPSRSFSLRGPPPLAGSACLRAPMLVLTEHPLIVGISPACLAKLGVGDLRLLWVFGALLEPDASCFYPHQERACTPQGLPTAMAAITVEAMSRPTTMLLHTQYHSECVHTSMHVHIVICMYLSLSLSLTAVSEEWEKFYNNNGSYVLNYTDIYPIQAIHYCIYTMYRVTE